MKTWSNVFYLHHSPWFGLPVLGEMLYLFQTWLVLSHKTRTIYISRRNTQKQQVLLKWLNTQRVLVVCKSHLFGRTLEALEQCTIVLDCSHIPNTTTAKYQLLWSTILAVKVTQRCWRANKNIIPQELCVSQVELAEMIEQLAR